MQYSDVIAAVGRITKRPDKDDSIRDAINDAIVYATTQGDFPNDLVEATISISGTVYSQSLVVSTDFTRYRKMKYMRPYSYRKMLDWRDPSRIFDNTGKECLDSWYRAGDNIVFKLSCLQTSMLVGYFQYPTRLDADADTHWFLEQMYPTIRNLACAQVFAEIGDKEESARLQALGLNSLVAHITDLRDGVSHA